MVSCPTRSKSLGQYLILRSNYFDQLIKVSLRILFDFDRVPPGFDKGHLISKCHFGVFNSSKKTNLKTLIFALAYWGRNFLFVFWKNLKHQKKRHFEINWPLGRICLKFGILCNLGDSYTPPRPSEISEKICSTKGKPFLISHLW